MLKQLAHTYFIMAIESVKGEIGVGFNYINLIFSV